MLDRLNRLVGPGLTAITLCMGLVSSNAPAIEGPDTDMAPTSNRPIVLAVTNDGDFLDVTVIAATPCACRGRFSLESIAGNSNRSINSGGFSSSTSEGTVLTRVRVRRPPTWDIKLVVEVEGQESYTEHRASPNLL